VIRPSILFWMIAVIAVGYAMFEVKMEVVQQEETLNHLNRQIAEGREQIRVLHAEWSFLTGPTRLDQLANRYLSLAPLKAAQTGRLDTLPERPGAPPALAGAPVATLPAITNGARFADVNASEE